MVTKVVSLAVCADIELVGNRLAVDYSNSYKNWVLN